MLGQSLMNMDAKTDTVTREAGSNVDQSEGPTQHTDRHTFMTMYNSEFSLISSSADLDKRISATQKLIFIM